MDIPNSRSHGSSQGESAPRLPNLHPSRMSPDQQHSYYGTIPRDDGTLGSVPDRLSSSPLSERIGSFVGSYSRTSLMFMAENLTVPSSAAAYYDDEEDKISVTSSMPSMSRVNTSGGESRRRRPSQNDMLQERSSLLMTSLDKVLSTHSVMTVADEYRFGDAHTLAPEEDTKKSSFAQSIFNSINILLGVGILALPLGFRCAGWAIGLLVFAFCCGLTNYTAKLLGRCLQSDPEIRTFGDMAGSAYGLRGRIFVTALFVTELITSTVALVILFGDGITSLFPGFDTLTVRIISFFCLTPMLFVPVRYLSYSSLLGIIGAFSIVIVMLYDGFTKRDAPGSLWESADTEVLPSDWMAVPLSFGLIMAGFAGHAVFPTVYHDMDDTKHYRKMVNWTYVITTIVYFGVAACGYRMFGSATMQEITQNLVLVPEYNQALNRLAVWMIALQPVAKYGLSLNPVNVSWQILLFRNQPLESWCAGASWREPVLTAVGKVIVSAFIVLLAYIIPGFHHVMGLLGAFFSFMISAIFPLLCHLELFGDTLSGKEKSLQYTLLVIASIMAASGTIWSFL